MNILIAGGTGLIGSRLTERLLQAGHTVTQLSRNPSKHAGKHAGAVGYRQWDGKTVGDWAADIGSFDGVVNLAGEGIGDSRWTESRKQVLLNGRIESTSAIVAAIGASSTRPAVLVNASAVGYYGDVPEGECTEDRSAGKDFLAHVCVEWENAALKAEEHGVRVAMPRTGIVLDLHGGALPKLLLPFRLFAGGPLGSGRQWFPWVHLEDEVGAILHALSTRSLSGPFNVAAPEYVTMKEFARQLGSVLGRPSWAPAPGFVLRLLLGEMAGPLLLSGQKAISDKLQRSGFSFSYPALRGALEHLLKKY